MSTLESGKKAGNDHMLVFIWDGLHANQLKEITLM